ncbi:CbiX/SirB N-terminal domain-containing protein [Glutamicibacter sp.]|uniref:sirohydrochlorin chelatase n=1 Tax=Glutamicibacter sp. TaxID=1931995 RepID=UPI0028BE1542|nr:CbiX/SirB N-terminal domain-containing protein [Glutamicibacter sp.]
MSPAAPHRIHILAASHGTDNPRGQQLIHQLRAQLEEQSGAWAVQLEWHEAYVDVQEPALPQVLEQLPAGEPAIVLPLLVADGVHTTKDIASAVAARPNASAASPLGALPQLAQVLAERAEAHLAEDQQVVLAAAGTRLEIGQQQIRKLAGLVAEQLRREVSVAYCAGANPRAEEVVASASSPVLLISALLADGYFQDKLASTGAAGLTSPLLPDVTIAQCFLVRLENALHEAGFMSLDDEE